MKSCGTRQAGNLKDKGLQLNKSKCKELHCKMVFAEDFGKLRNKARTLYYRFHTDFCVQLMQQTSISSDKDCSSVSDIV